MDKNHFQAVPVLTTGFCLFALTLVLAAPLRVLGDEAREIREGTLALFRGDYLGAQNVAAQYLEIHPESVPARILLARSEIAQGHYVPAYDALRRALELDPTNIDALYYLERLCTILSQIEFRRLVETAPGS